MRLLSAVPLLIACTACSDENPSPQPGGYGVTCSGASDCQSGLCVTSGAATRCSQDCSDAPCPGSDPCVEVGSGKVCGPGAPPACATTCSGSVNGVPYSLKCGESSACLSGKKMTCKESGVVEEFCSAGCACNTSSTCQLGCSCDPDCPPIADPKKWGEACSCGAEYDGKTMWCAGTDPERCGMKLTDPNGSRWGCFWTGKSGFCTYRCATSGEECPDNAACNEFPSDTGTWRICAAP